MAFIKFTKVNKGTTTKRLKLEVPQQYVNQVFMDIANEVRTEARKPVTVTTKRGTPGTYTTFAKLERHGVRIEDRVQNLGGGKFRMILELVANDSKWARIAKLHERGGTARATKGQFLWIPNYKDGTEQQGAVPSMPALKQIWTEARKTYLVGRHDGRIHFFGVKQVTYSAQRFFRNAIEIVKDRFAARFPKVAKGILKLTFGSR